MSLTCFDVMVPTDRQRTIHPDHSVAEALQIIKETRARFLPVVDDEGLYLGVFTSPTMLKLILPQAATIGLEADGMRVAMNHLSFMSLSKADFAHRVGHLKDERVSDHLSNPENIPVAHPETPLMEGIFLIYKHKRHVILVEPKSNRFVGTISSNSVFDAVID